MTPRELYEELVLLFIEKPIISKETSDEDILLLIESLKKKDEETGIELAEQARKQDLVDRWQAINPYKREAFNLAGYAHVPNLEAEFFLPKILENPNHEEAESIMQLVEAKKAFVEAEIDAVENSVTNKRRKEYLALGITNDKMIVDLWERVVENRPEASNATQALRETVKQKFPKKV